MCAGTKVGVVTDAGAETGACGGIDNGVGNETSADIGGTGGAAGTGGGVGAGAGVDMGAGVGSSAIAALEAGREGTVVGSGVAVAVAVDSPGVETEGVVFFPAVLRPAASIAVEFLITFAVGSVPRGAMPATAPSRSNPASTKLGRGGAKEGSTHLSNIVFGLSLSAIVFEVSLAELFGTGPNGLLYRERVGRGVGVLISKSPRCDRPPPFLQLRPRIQDDWRLVSSGVRHAEGELVTSLQFNCMYARLRSGLEVGERAGVVGGRIGDGEGEF